MCLSLIFSEPELSWTALGDNSQIDLYLIFYFLSLSTACQAMFSPENVNIK